MKYICKTVAVPGSNGGFSMAVWDSKDVPVGTEVGARTTVDNTSLDDLTSYGFAGNTFGFEFRPMAKGEYLRKHDVQELLSNSVSIETAIELACKAYNNRVRGGDNSFHDHILKVIKEHKGK